LNKGVEVNFEERYKKFWERKPNQAHGAIFSKAINNKPVDPVEMTLKSEKAEKVLDGIKDRIYKGAKKQLNKSKPGLILCFLQGIDDLSELADESGLQIMTCYLLDKPELSHIAAISYCAETRIEKYLHTETYSNQGLIFRNPNCKFEEAKNFQFLS